jgi:hypothetical protein
MKVYFWVKLSRTTGRVGTWTPGLATDAQATGVFGDSVEAVYFNTVWPGQWEQDVRQKVQTEVSWLAMECGFSSYQVVTISETDYFAFTRKYAEARLEAMGVTKLAIKLIKENDANVANVLYSVTVMCAPDERAELDTAIKQLTANFKEVE